MATVLETFSFFPKGLSSSHATAQCSIEDFHRQLKSQRRLEVSHRPNTKDTGRSRAKKGKGIATRYHRVYIYPCRAEKGRYRRG